MTSIYCWFDWDDMTTTVNSINIIRDPRKPWNEYLPGEEIVANLPKYGMWNGVIVEVSDSRKDLQRKMNERQTEQKRKAGLGEKTDSRKDLQQKTNERQTEQKRKAGLEEKTDSRKDIQQKTNERQTEQTRKAGLGKKTVTTKRCSNKVVKNPNTNNNTGNKTSATPMSTITNEDVDKSISSYFGLNTMSLDKEAELVQSVQSTSKDNTERTPTTSKQVTPRISGIKRPLSKKYIDVDTDTSDSDTDENLPVLSSTMVIPLSSQDFDIENSAPLSPITSDDYLSSDNDDTISLQRQTLTPLEPMQLFMFQTRVYKSLENQKANKCPRTVPMVPFCTQEACIQLQKENEGLKEEIGMLRAKNTRLERECKDKRPLCESTTPNSPAGAPQSGIYYDRQIPREHKMVELVRGSSVFLFEKQLNIVTESAKSMTAMARLLVDVFFTFDKQKKSNLSGENGLQKLNKPIVDTIISFVVSRDLKKQSPSEIRQSLRNKLGCFRAPSRIKKLKTKKD